MATHKRSERGAVLVEAAIMVPLLVFLVFGIWTTARAWNVHNTLDHAAREAARYGAVAPDPLTGVLAIAEGEVIAASIPWSDITECAAIVEDQASGTPTITSTGSVPCIPFGTDPGQDPTTDDRVQVSLLYDDYTLDFLFFDVTVDLAARAVARLERGA